MSDLPATESCRCMSVFAQLSPALVTALAAQGITEPTPVQAAVIPDAMAGHGRARARPDRLRQDPRLRAAHPGPAGRQQVAARATRARS